MRTKPLVYGALFVTVLLWRTVTFCNRVFDRGSDTAHLARVEQVVKRITGYSANLVYWRDPSRFISVEISKELYQNILAEQQGEIHASWLVVHSRPGRFGIEWTSEVSLSHLGSPNACLTVAYRVAKRDQKRYRLDQTNLPPRESETLAQIFHLTDLAFANRVWTKYPGKCSPPASKEAILAELALIHPDAKLAPVMLQIVDAVNTLGRQPATAILHFKDTAEELKSAYTALLLLYPQETIDNRRAFLSHLHALAY